MSCVSLHSLFTQFFLVPENFIMLMHQKITLSNLWKMWTRLRPVYSYHLSMVDISRHYDQYVWFHDSRLFSPDNALLLLFRSAVSIPLKKKTRSCPYSVTLLYMWTRCKRLFRQFNKKDYTKFEKLKSVKFISSYSTLVSRLLGMTSKTYIDTHSPFNPFYIHVPHLSHSRVKLKFLTKVKNFTSLILQD